ncbi:hypothetical protein QTP88_025540 [Uroleucon formosanum]
MGKVKQSTSARLRDYVSEFESAILSTDGFVLFCKVCELKINFEKKFNVSQHIRTEKHLKSAKRQKDQVQRKSQQLLTNQPTKSDFNKDLCETMVAANIPIMDNCNDAEVSKKSYSRFLYTQADLISAVSSINNKEKTLNAVHRETGISKSTLSNKINNKVPMNRKMSPPTVQQGSYNTCSYGSATSLSKSQLSLSLSSIDQYKVDPMKN